MTDFAFADPKEKLDPNGHSAVPSYMLPTFRTAWAVERGVEKKLMLRTWGGIGDQICAEPTLRYALETFKGCEIHLASEIPEFFRHLRFASIFDLRRHQPIWDQYFVFDTIFSPQGNPLQWEFMSHMLVNCVDFPSLCAFRCQLPVSYKPVQLVPSHRDLMDSIARLSHVDLTVRPAVLIHAGRHWQSKTFPAEWWNAVIEKVNAENCTPVLIGGNADDNRTTVDVDSRDCIDLRGQISLMQSVALLQQTFVLLTNDSAPLHMAVTGSAWVGYVATCKHPDMISHWRKRPADGKVIWNWRMKNFGKGGIWDVLDYCPNTTQTVEVENVGDHLLEWLPDPVEFAMWGVEKARLEVSKILAGLSNDRQVLDD